MNRIISIGLRNVYDISMRGFDLEMGMKINKTSICLILGFGCTDYEIKNIETTTEQEEDVEEGLQPVGGSNGNNSNTRLH